MSNRSPAYARQFLDQMQKPEVDFIEGLSPAIAIEQRSSGANPRSTNRHHH
jgi:excinuclease ABC subunit A